MGLDHKVFEMRAVKPDEVGEFLSLLSSSQGRTASAEYLDAWDGAFDFERNLALFRDGRLIGTATGGRVLVTVPGPCQVAAVVTGNLAVAPEERTPGLGLRIFHAQCERHRGDGVPFLVFSVSGREMAAAHQRIGSAPMTFSATVEAVSDRPATAGADDAQALSLLSGELDEVHERLAARTPGMIVRERSWMRTYRTLSAAAAPWQVTGLRGTDGRLASYAVWRKDTEPGRERIVADEFAAVEPWAWRGLARHLSAQGHVLELRNRPLRDPAWWLLSRRGEVRTLGWQPALWIRILDVRTALEGRGYFTSGAICLDVRDAFLGGGGRFRLESDGGSASCRPTTQSPDVSLDIGALGALFQGDADVWSLACAGLLEAEREENLSTLGRLLASPGTPWSGSER